MTRQETLDSYDVDAHGRITSPGKFEGEPVFAPHFWDIGMNGFADDDNGSEFRFKITKDDDAHKEFPELRAWLGRSRTLRLREDDQGFVHCR